MDELNFLRELNKDLRSKARKLSVQEAMMIFGAIEQFNLLTSMYSSRMFGGYGIAIYEHESYPGTGPQMLLSIDEDHLPEELCSSYRRSQGCGKEEAWKKFSKYTHSEKNAKWLAMYKMEKPREQTYYDY